MTVAKVLTPAGRGAIAVIQVEGPQAVEAINDCFQTDFRSFEQSKLNAIRFGRWVSEQGEELIAIRTKEEQVEIHCHGGSAATEAILKSLSERGVQKASDDPFLNQQELTPLAAEASKALSSAPTEQVAACLLDQVNGALDEAIQEILKAIDLLDVSLAISKIEELLSWKRLGRALSEPWRVVLAGPPNVGKSSLTNALVGYERAIVFDQPGTTRDVVTATTAIKGWPVQLSDTAGLRDTDEPIEAAGVELARQTLLSADLVLVVIEASKVEASESQEFIEAIRRQSSDDALLLFIASKADLTEQNAPISLHPAQLQPTHMLATSTVNGTGIVELLAKIGEKLVPKQPEPGQAILFQAQQFEWLKRAKEALETDNRAKAAERLCCLLAGSSI